MLKCGHAMGEGYTFVQLKKSTIQIVIALSIISLVGVLFSQAIWMHHAIVITERRFDQSVTDAMNNTVEALEKKTVFNTFHKEFTPDSNRKTEVRVMMKSNDAGTVDILRVDSLVRINGPNDTFKYITHNNQSLVFAGDSFGYLVHERMGDIVGKIMAEITTDSLAIRLPIKPAGVDSILPNALQQEGIKGNFDYAIKGPKGAFLFKSAGFNTSNNSYKVLMYPLHIHNRPDELLVQVHNKNQLVMKSISPIIMGSFVFTLLIVVTFLLTIRTILKQKKLSRIKNDFINNMTHEFKTPIATISIAADAIKESGGQAGNFAAIIKQESLNMNQKVETILQMALLEQNQVKLGMKITGLHDIISEALVHMALQLEKNGAEVKTALRATKTLVMADVLHLTNVFANILDNAVKYSAGEVFISINTANENDFAVVSIADKGIGMTKDEQKKVFDKFYRAQSGNVHNTKGFGLGLSYAHEIVRMHGGSISIESEKFKGTTVKISLPIAQ